MTLTAEEAGVPNEAAAYLKSLEDPEVIERVRCSIPDAHIFKLPPRPTSGGWRGADWDKEVWQGTLKVVERGDLTVILLVDRSSSAIFAVCPVKDGAVDRCVDSSRYFVLRVENAKGGHMFIGMAFNERNDAFDFNTALEDARREREAEKNTAKIDHGPPKDYSIKDGQKIHISVGKVKGRRSGSSGGSGGSSGGGGGGGGGLSPSTNSGGGGGGGSRRTGERTSVASTAAVGGFLKPSRKDTPRRAPTGTAASLATFPGSTVEGANVFQS